MAVEQAKASAASETALGLDDVYREHAATVSRWARRLAGPGADVEDLLHDVFVVVQRRLPEFRGECRITTWLYAITVRVVQDRRRRERWRRWLRLPGGGSRHELATDEPGPLQALEARQAVDLTYRLLERLADRDRTVLILFELEGLPGTEIAALLGTSTQNVWVRLHRARTRFRQAFLDWERRSRHDD
jgi:RNA polymerase sigma-70 factor (ECF subfamily)